MKRSHIYLLCIVSLISGCHIADIDLDEVPEVIVQKDWTKVDATVSMSQTAAGALGSPLTRGLIDQVTIEPLSGNFIMVSETRKDGWSENDYVYTPFKDGDWDKAQIVDAEIAAPDNTRDIHFRSMSFSPALTYQYNYKETDSGQDTVVYATRMVGWYPATFDVPEGSSGGGTNYEFNRASGYRTVDGRTCVEFKNKLDGETDVMVTDMREGRMWHTGVGNTTPFRNNDNDIDIQPYGHQFKNYLRPDNGYKYCNYFTFHHYLTAIRLFVIVPESSLNVLAWGKIDEVLFTDQPTSLTVALPVEQARAGTGTELVPGTTPSLPAEQVKPVFGEAVEWADPANMSIIKTAMTNGNSMNNTDFDTMTADYPIDFEHGVVKENTYLGYMLVQPSKNTEIQIHTDAGILKATIPAIVTDENNNKIDVLEAGKIYYVYIDMHTDGSLDVVIGQEDGRVYRDLSPYNSAIADFEYANCYVITQDLMKRDVVGDEQLWYDGFFFDAMTAGCGEKGVLDASLYPTNVHFEPKSVQVLWQDPIRPISYVELVHGHVRFVLNEGCYDTDSPVEGNAVIAAYDDDWKILWSWHIWVTNALSDIDYGELAFEDYESYSGSTTNLPIDNMSEKVSQVIMMNMNLGARHPSWTDASDVLATYGLYYQWGRKDPSPGPSSYDYVAEDLLTAEFYSTDGPQDRVSEMFLTSPGIEESIQFPLAILTPNIINVNYPNDWMATPTNSLWGYDSEASGREWEGGCRQQDYL